MATHCWAVLASLVLVLVANVHGKRVPWWSIRIAQQQGPHACVVEEVPGTYLELWTECRYWTHRKICGQKTLIRYECCEGYQQLGENNGCTAVKPLKNILETAEDLGARRFVAAIRESGLADELNKDGAFTLFAPTDHAFDWMRMSVSLRAALEGGGGSRDAVLLYHLLDGKLTSKEIRGDQLVPTRSGGAKLRLNRYSNQMRTANCHLLLRKDQQATNGVVHVIDGVLDPDSLSRTPAVDLVAQDGRFSILTEALRRAGYAEELRDLQRAVTLLAPSDEAFQKLPQSQRDTILGDPAALRALLQNHVIAHPICKSAILGEHKLKSKAGNRLTFQCDRDKVFIERSEVSNAEMLTEDGVVHAVDDVIIPDRARSLLELAGQQQDRKLNTFLSLVRVAGLQERLGSAGDLTLFAPTDAAFRAMPAGWWEATRSDPEAARRLLLFHGTQGRRLSRDIADNQVVTSLDGSSVLRLQVHRGALGVEDATIVQPDLEGRNGVLHIIDRVLQPATSSAGDILRQSGGFSTFLQSMETVMMANGSDLAMHAQGASTFFVPTDEAFRALDLNRLNMLIGDVKMLTQTVKHHISERMLPAGSFQPNLTYHINTRHGLVNVRKAGDQIMVGKARILKRDILNTNGIIHVIDKVLLPSRVRKAYFRSQSRSHATSEHGSYGTSVSKRVTTSERRHRVRQSGGSYSYRTETSRRVHNSG